MGSGQKYDELSKPDLEKKIINDSAEINNDNTNIN